MAGLPIDFSATQKPAQIQANLMAYMRLFSGLPGITTVDDEETFWIVSHSGAPGDSILRTCWTGENIEARIDALFARVGSLTGEIGWMVFPGDQLADLGKRLERRGMTGSRAGNWLWADLDRLGAAPAVGDDFHIEPVLDDQGLAEWVRASEAGFGGGLGYYFPAYSRHGYGDEAFSLHFTGYLGNTPVTSGTLLEAGGCASIYDVSTPPDLCRRGFGGALTHALMLEIRKKGYRDTWIWSSDTGRSVYQKLGYIDADFGLREYQWSKGRESA